MDSSDMLVNLSRQRVLDWVVMSYIYWEEATGPSVFLTQLAKGMEEGCPAQS